MNNEWINEESPFKTVEERKECADIIGFDIPETVSVNDEEQ
jgi:hypothetical protein